MYDLSEVKKILIVNSLLPICDLSEVIGKRLDNYGFFKEDILVNKRPVNPIFVEIPRLDWRFMGGLDTFYKYLFSKIEMLYDEQKSRKILKS